MPQQRLGAEVNYIAKELGIDGFYPGPIDPLARQQLGFVYGGKEFLVQAEDLREVLNDLLDDVREAKRKANANLVHFGVAVARLKEGARVARKGWNGKGMWLELQVPDAHSKMSLPYIYMKTADDKLVPWLASQTDILSEDWEIIDD